MVNFKSTANEPAAFSMESICRSNNLMRNLLEIIESHPNEIAVNFGKSIIFFIEDDFSKTLDYLEFLIQRFPNISLLHRRIAEIFIHENNYQKAITHLKKSFRIRPYRSYCKNLAYLDLF